MGGGSNFSLGIGSYDNSSVNRSSSSPESPLRPSNGGQLRGQQRQQQQHSRAEMPSFAGGTMRSPIQFSRLAGSSRPHSSFTMGSCSGGSNNVDFGTTASATRGPYYEGQRQQQQIDNNKCFDGSQSTHPRLVSSFNASPNDVIKNMLSSSGNNGAFVPNNNHGESNSSPATSKAKSSFVASRRNSICRPAAGMRPQVYDCDNERRSETTTIRPMDHSQNLSPCTLRLRSQSYRDNNVERRTDPLSSAVAESAPMTAAITTGQHHPSRASSADNLDASSTVMKRRRVNNSHNSDMLLLEMLNDTVVDSPASSPSPTAAVEPSAIRAADHRSLLATSDRLLEMLNDTVMSPAVTAAKPSLPVAGRSLDSNGGNLGGASAPFNSPYSNYAEPTLARQQQRQVVHDAESKRASSSASSLTPMSQTQVMGGNNNNKTHAQNNMMMMMVGNNTPRMFADLFLGRTPGSANGNAAGLDMVGAMPPPPLVNMFDPNKANQTVVGEQHYHKAALQQRVHNDDSPLPLPPVRKSQQKKSRKGQKKNKDGTASSADTSNHIVTPSSATISALSKEIRSKMKEDEKAAAGKRDGENETAQSSTATNTAGGKSDDADGDEKFVPRFASAMEATQASQQAIHDWDRKFGLRRAHSKTMRETCRSRKRVLEFLKGEGSEIALLKKSLSASDKTKHGLSSRASDVADTNADVLDEKNKEEHAMAVDEQDNANNGAVPHDKMAEADEYSEGSTGRKEAFQDERQWRARQEHSLFLPSSSSHSRPVPQAGGGDDNSRENSKHRGHHFAGQFANNSDIDNDQAGRREHEDADKKGGLRHKSSQDSGCSSSVSGSSSKLDEQHVQLEQLFRRASLDYVDAMLPVGTLCRPAPQEADRKQYHARGA